VIQVFELMSSGGDIIVSADKYGFVGAGTIAIRNTEFSRTFIEVSPEATNPKNIGKVAEHVIQS
jgi:hypothetical protein